MQNKPFREIQIIATLEGKEHNIAWLHLQPDKSISFGLNNKYFYAPNLDLCIPLFNAYNIITSSFTIAEHTQNTKYVKNPHFTYHPLARFHLKTKETLIWWAIAPMDVVFMQQERWEWIQSISRSIEKLPIRNERQGKTKDPWLINCVNNCSLKISVDMLRPNSLFEDSELVKHFLWGDIQVQVSIEIITPQNKSTLSWIHEH